MPQPLPHETSPAADLACRWRRCCSKLQVQCKLAHASMSKATGAWHKQHAWRSVQPRDGPRSARVASCKYSGKAILLRKGGRLDEEIYYGCCSLAAPHMLCCVQQRCSRRMLVRAGCKDGMYGTAYAGTKQTHTQQLPHASSKVNGCNRASTPQPGSACLRACHACAVLCECPATDIHTANSAVACHPLSKSLQAFNHDPVWLLPFGQHASALGQCCGSTAALCFLTRCDAALCRVMAALGGGVSCPSRQHAFGEHLDLLVKRL